MIKLNLLLKFIFVERIDALNEQKERKRMQILKREGEREERGH